MQSIPIGPPRDDQPQAFNVAPAVHPATQGDTAETDTVRDYLIQVATYRAGEPAFRQLWQTLVAESHSPQKIYQSPDYFQFLSEARAPGERLELLVVVRRSDAAVVGVVPLRIGTQEICFNIGKWVLWRQAVEMIALLGSIPSIPAHAALAEYLALHMLALFPEAKAVYMQALPVESAHWQHLDRITAPGRPLARSLMGHRRDCHTLPLPASFEQYVDKFSAKKRYNLNRQIRQLGEQAGVLDMVRIERPEQIAPMMAWLQVLLSEQEMATVLKPVTLEALARRSLLLCYVLRAGDDVLAAVFGTRSPDVLHIHKIFVSKKHMALSVGTSAMHLAIKDLTALGCFTMIDFGYGSPNHEFRSSHLLETRAQVLLFERTRPVGLLFRAHSRFQLLAESAIARIKTLRKRLQGRRSAKSA